MTLEEIRALESPMDKIRAWYDLISDGKITDNPDAGDIDGIIDWLLGDTDDL